MKKIAISLMVVVLACAKMAFAQNATTDSVDYDHP